MANTRKKVIIMGAAGRDFHNFNTVYRNNKDYEVVAFTAFQIPDIDGRTYPKEIAGELYPNGIPIYAESELPALIKKHNVDEVVFAYSDLSHVDVMHRASLVNSLGPDFVLIGTKDTMVKSTKPLISVCAIRTGCGKSQTSRAIAKALMKKGKKVAQIRHPMPYGDLNAQRCQRFASMADIDRHKCTIEEREEYEFPVQQGIVVYAGVDYEMILREAEKEADVILWDGGNNDTPFYKPDLQVVVLDPHRAGHEVTFYPGETNLNMAQIALINKVNTAKPEGIATVKESLKRNNPKAIITIPC